MPHPTTTARPSGPPVRSEPLLRRLVGAVLRERREAQGRTLRDVAGEAQVSVAYLSEIERGRKEPSSEVLGAVCRALGIRLVDLLGDAWSALSPQAPVLDLTARAAAHDVAATRATAVGREGAEGLPACSARAAVLRAA